MDFPAKTLNGRVLTILASVLTLTSAPAQTVPGQQAKAAEIRTTYLVITKGLLGTPVFTFPLLSGTLVLNARNLIMGPGKAINVPIPEQMIVEVRGGSVQATIAGKTAEYRAGDFFVVEKGATFSLENRGDVAVMRALYIAAANNGGEIR